MFLPYPHILIRLHRKLIYDLSLFYNRVKFWIGNKSVEDVFRCFIPPTSISNENMMQTCNFVRSSHRLAIRVIGDELDLSFYAVRSIMSAESWSKEQKNIYAVYRNNLLLYFYLIHMF